MRMWIVDPEVLCRHHLLGEHNEIHKHRHVFVKKHSIAGRRGQIEPKAMKCRHDELVREMTRRGYNHKSPYEQPDISHLPDVDRLGKVNESESFNILISKCKECRDRARMLALTSISARENFSPTRSEKPFRKR